MEHQNKLETVSPSVSGGPTPKATSNRYENGNKKPEVNYTYGQKDG